MHDYYDPVELVLGSACPNASHSSASEEASESRESTPEGIYLTDELDNPPLSTPQLDTPQLGTPQLDTPQLETQPLDTPPLETPQIDTPQPDMSQVDILPSQDIVIDLESLEI